jgi:hypothetical protein
MRAQILSGVTAVGLTLSIAATAGAAPTHRDDDRHGRGPAFTFTPLTGSAYGVSTADWALPFLLPTGYTQQLVADETGLDISAGAHDLTDMSTGHETRRQPGR